MAFSLRNIATLHHFDWPNLQASCTIYDKKLDSREKEHFFYMMARQKVLQSVNVDMIAHCVPNVVLKLDY